MTLNTFYHETFKKWLKGKCSRQSASVTNFFEERGIQAFYDEKRDMFVIQSSDKEYAKREVEETLDNEEEFIHLVTEMIEK